jgi:hypothetical protein
MWLAHNRQADETVLAGSLGDEELAAALRFLPVDHRLPANLTELRELHGELTARLHRQRNSPDPGWAVLDLSRAVKVTDSLIAAHRTAALLRKHVRDALDDIALRRALVIASRTLDAANARVPLSVTDAVEQAALSYPSATEPDSRHQLARFVVALVDGAGLDPGQRGLKEEWDVSVGRIEAYNDALRERAESPPSRGFRLVVSYDALASEWPLSIRAWVLYGGRECGKNHEIRCTADQSGAEAALVAAVSWAENEAASIGESLDRIEVAMPAMRLLDWHPEKVRYNGAWLGVNYRVLPRWSRRLERTKEMQGSNTNVRRRLAELPSRSKASRLHWLGAHEVGDLRTLCEELAMGRYGPASGLMNRPRQEDSSLVDLLLMYLPILLWPQGDSLGPQHRRRVATGWNRLPDEFFVAYRARWAGRVKKKFDLIADVRAVWDDEDWLGFCGTAGAVSRRSTEERP